MIHRTPESDSQFSPPTTPPYNRPNDRWVETPVKTDQSLETIRKPSLRTRRRNFTLACTAFTIGAVLIICTSPYGKEFLVPGPLSSHHAPLVAGEGSNRCASCHANANGSLVDWIAATFVSAKHDGLSQSDLCMKCHEKSLASQFALNPHNVEPAALNKISTKFKQTSFDSGMGFHPPVNEQNQIACSACHREHHGGQGLASMTDAQCQSCHSQSFHSFEHDHPEFISWPQQRRSRIAFDHATHSGKHFPGKNQAFNCNQCHLDDEFQNVKKLAPYEQSCAQCHNQQILESNAQGLALIALPMIDTEAIEAANLKVGSWPLANTGDFDGIIPPMMRVMLAADPKANLILESRGAGFEFSDFDPTRSEDVKMAVELVWAIKRLLYDLSIDGPHAVRSRLETVLGFEISDQQLQRIITNLDEPVFQNAVRRWLPDLPSEVAINRHGIADLIGETGLAKGLLEKNENAWLSDHSERLLKMTKDELLAQNPLAGLLARSNPRPAALPVVRVPAPQPPNVSPSQETDQASENVKPKPRKRWQDNIHADPKNNPNVLAVNPLPQLLMKDAENASPDSRAVDLPKVNTPPLPETGLAGRQAKRPDQTPEPLPSDTQQSGIEPSNSTSAKTLPAEPAEPLIVPSGWFRNDTTFQISYRPQGHADDCLQSWIELVTRAADADTRVETQQLFKKTISMTGVGLCRTCHTVDQLPDRSFWVNWTAEYRDPSIRSFTRFAHGPHLLQPKLQDCSGCHQLDPHASNAESFLGVDASQVVSNFAAITKSNCISCHQSGRTSNSCTQCHNYHVGSHVVK